MKQKVPMICNIVSLILLIVFVIISGIPSRCFPPFLAVWGGQTERETPLADHKLHAARFEVCVGLAALVRVLSGVGGKPLL